MSTPVEPLRLLLLAEELLGDGLVAVLAVEPVAGLEDPVVGIANVARVDDELVVVDGLRKTADGDMERRRDEGSSSRRGDALRSRS